MCQKVLRRLLPRYVSVPRVGAEQEHGDRWVGGGAVESVFYRIIDKKDGGDGVGDLVSGEAEVGFQ